MLLVFIVLKGEVSVSSYDQNKLFLVQGNHYGVVGFQNKRLKCYTCPPFLSHCAHTGFVEDNRGNHDYPVIDVFYSFVESDSRNGKFPIVGPTT